jgi:UDP-N-acetylmuramoyl-L-alanyl-D-glutamate--2,6-diaminopimelate ligase
VEAIKLAKTGDIILCAGKGHEDYQEIKGVKHHFSDMEEFRKAYKL